MWRLQPRKHNRYLIWLPWISLALVPHLVLLMMFAMPTTRQTYHVSLGSYAQGRQYLPVVFVPQVSRVKQNTVVAAQPVAQPKTKKPVAQLKKPAANKQAVLNKGVSVAKSPAKTPPAKKHERVVNKKIELPKVAPKHDEKPKPQAALAKAPEPPKAPVAPTPQTVEQVAAPQEAMYVGREQLTVLEIENHIHTIVGEKWRPPASLKPGLSCQIKLIINALGIVTETSIARSSGVAVFDIAARQACKELEKIPGITAETELYITLD